MSDTLDALADGQFQPVTNRRAGYTDALEWAFRQARKGGTLGAGEGLLIIKHMEMLVRAAYYEGVSHGYARVPTAPLSWDDSEAKRALEATHT